MKMVFVTCPEEEARGIQRALLNQHLAAGVTMLPGGQSSFWWKSGIENAQESVLIIRTEERLLSKVMELIRGIHPYEVPEVIALDAVSLNPAYTKWLSDELSGAGRAGRERPAGTATSARPVTETQTVRIELSDVLKAASSHPLKVILVGAPGAGARSAGYRIARRLMWPVFSPVEKLATEIGLGAAADAGDLVPDEKILKLAAGELQRLKGGGVLVGFPRTQAQADALGKVWERPDVVFILNLNRDQAMKRLKMRLSCSCGRTYSPSLPPHRAGLCDGCGARLFHRKDDTADDAIVKRYLVWTNTTRPMLLSTYVSEVYPVDASQTYENVLKEISQGLSKKMMERAPGGR